MLVSKLAHMRAARGLTLSPDRLVAALLPSPSKPTKLARVVTYVGGDPLPGAKRAIGVWDGGAEPSNVLETDSSSAEALAAQNHQKSAIWFQPGQGNDSLHVFTVPESPAQARAMLNKHGVTYATLVPTAKGTQVHVVDQGGEFDGVLPGSPQKGTATFRQVGATKLGRAPEEHVRGFVQAQEEQHDQAAARGFVGGGADRDHNARQSLQDFLDDHDDPRATIIRNDIGWGADKTHDHAHPDAPEGTKHHSGYPFGAALHSTIFNPYDFRQDRIVPTISEERYRDADGATRYRQRPAIAWKSEKPFYPPGGPDEKAGIQFHPVLFYAPVSLKDFWAYVDHPDSMTPEKREHWENFARQKGWQRPPDELHAV